MSMRVDAATPGTAGRLDGPAPAGYRRIVRPLVIAGLFTAAWLLPIVTQALRADWLLLVVLLLGTASLLRAGYCLLDRLMLAMIMLAGALVTGGLLFSLWPWGLAPLPIAGTLLTVLVAVGVLTGRRPRLPVRLRCTDAIIVGAGSLAAWMMLGPVGGKSFSAQLPYTTGAEDKYAHFALFDAIQRQGSYTFLDPSRARSLVTASTAHVYPQGSHYLYGVLDLFLRSSASPGATPAEFSRYFAFTLFGFGFLVLAVTWSARWVAGPAMTGWRRAFICSAVAVLAAVGPLTGVVRFAFDSETIGLVLLALTLAVLARPAGRPREQVLLVAAALITEWYSYNLYGALASLGVIAAVVVYRRRLLRHWLFAAVVAVVTVPVALLPSVLAELSGFSANRQLAQGGDVNPLNWFLFGGLALLVCASMATSAGRRSGTWRVMAAAVVLAVGAIAAFRLYQVQALGSAAEYYFDKLLTAAYVICLVGFGAAGLLLRAPRDPVPGMRLSRRRAARRRARLLPAITAGVTAVALASGVLWALPGYRSGHADYTQAWAYRWMSGQEQAGPGHALQAAEHAHLLADGTPTLIIFTDVTLENWRASFFAAVLNRDLGRMKGIFNPMLAAGPLMISRGRHRIARRDHDLSIVEAAIANGPHDIRVIVSASTLAARLKSFADAHPGLDLTVLYLPQMNREPQKNREPEPRRARPTRSRRRTLTSAK